MKGKVLLVGGEADGRWVPGNKLRAIAMMKRPADPVDDWLEQPVCVTQEVCGIELYRPIRFTGSTPGVEIIVYAVEGMSATEVLLKLVEGYRPETDEQKNAKGTK